MSYLEAFSIVCYNPIFMFVWGACWGSFLNVVMYRYPLGKSVVFPPSACPSCHKQIRPYDNIPVLSWFILGGKCRACKAPFSIRYALVEGLMGAACASAWAVFPNRPIAGLAMAHATLALIPAAFLLSRHGKVPWYLSLVGLSSLALYLQQVFFNH